MHYCTSLLDAVIEAKELSFGERIEIMQRYGSLKPIAIIDSDGRVSDSFGNPLFLCDKNGNKI